MADLWSWFGDIGKKLHGIEAQINPWDNGENYQSVVNGGPRYQNNPAPSQPSVRPQAQSSFNPGLNNFETPAAQVQQPKVDINANANLSQQQQNKSKDDIVHQFEKFVGENIVKPTAEDVSKAYNTVSAPITGLTGAAMVGADNLFNGGRNADNLAAATKAAVEENIRDSFVPQDVASGKANPIEFAGDFTKTGIHLAPYTLPGGGKLIDQFGNKVAENVGGKFLNPLINNAAKVGVNASISIPTFASLNASQQGIDSGFTSFDPGQATQAGLESGLLTAGSSITQDALSSALRSGRRLAIPSVDMQARSISGGIEPPQIRNEEPLLLGQSQVLQAKVPTRMLPQTPKGIPTLQRTETAAPAASNSSPFNENYTPLDVSKYVNEMDKARESARGGGFNPGNIKSELKTKLVDRFAPIEDPLRKAIKNGADISPANDIRPQIDRALRSDTIAGQYLKDNGLVDIVGQVPSTKEFEQYLIAKHGADLEKNGVKTGRNIANDKQLVDSLSSTYEPFAKDIARYSHGLLDKSVEYGLISKDLAKSLKTRYPNYVPFNRVFGDGEIQGFKGTGSGKASISSQSVVKKIKGSERQIESPLSSLVKKTQDVIDQGERNKAASLLASYKELPGNPFNLRELKKDETIGSKNTISFLDRGVKRTFETTPEVAVAAKNLNPEQLGLVGKILAVPTRVLRLGATGLNPAFTLANVAKDFGTAFINSEHPFRISDPQVLYSAMKAAFNHRGKEYGELVREAAGGTSFDIARGRNPVDIKKLRAERNAATKALYTVTRPSELFRAVENTIGRGEEFGRALQYFASKKAAVRSGLSESEAKIKGASAARSNTVNFARAGEYGRVLNSVLPYLNAGIQGSRTFVRNAKERPIQTFGKMVIAGFMPIAATTVWNISDPQRKKAYDNISEYEKQNNIIIIPPNPKQDASGRWNVIKIPLSQELANFSSIVRRGIEGNIDPLKTAGDIVGTTTSLNAENPRQLLGQFTPQAVKPVAESLLNQNLFTGQQIVPDSIKNLSPEDQANKSTSGTALALGKATGISPLLVDNAIRTSTGGLGQNLINLSDKTLAATGVTPKDKIAGQSFLQSISNRFNSAQGTTEGGLYYQTLEQTAKDHKLAGKDYELLNAILAKEVDSNGAAKPSDDKTRITNNLILANNPSVAAVRADAAKKLAKITGKPVDPLYELSSAQQEQYYRMQASPRGGQDYRNFQKKNQSWLPDFQQKRAKFFNDNPIPSTNNNASIPYPEDSPEVQKMLDTYGSLEGPAKTQYLVDHPQISKSFENKAKYTNSVRSATGYDPLKTYTQASPRVQSILDSLPQGTDRASKKVRAQAYNDPEVAKWMEDNSVYQLTKDAALAQIQGNDLTQSGLKAINSIGNYDLVRNPDGTLALKYGNGVQPGAVDLSGFSTYGKKGRRRKGSKGTSLTSIRDLAFKSSIPKIQAPNLTKKSAVSAPQLVASKRKVSRIPKRPNVRIKKS